MNMHDMRTVLTFTLGPGMRIPLLPAFVLERVSFISLAIEGAHLHKSRTFFRQRTFLTVNSIPP